MHWVCSSTSIDPEDSILSKLRWFKDGNEVDSKQLQDVIDVIRTQSGRLDDDYLNRWSRILGLQELLAKARTASV